MTVGATKPRARGRSALIALMTVLLGGCRASTSAAAPDARSDGVPAEAASPETGPDTAAPVCPTEAAGTRHAAPCPSTCPAASSACSTEGARCEYGDDPRGPACRSSAWCSNGVWSTTAPVTSRCEALTPATDCPPSSSAAAGQTCAVEHSLCVFASEATACLCTTCTWNGGVLLGPCPAGAPTWQCPTRPTGLDPRCPAIPPTLGTTCTSSDVPCLYMCGPGGLRSCQGGVWIGTNGGLCPV
jgi:hypothetical protein